jgi:LysM repeat protein
MTVPADLPHAPATAERSQPNVPGELPTNRDGPSQQARISADGLCPYLASVGGAWRTISVARDHRCIALAPPAAQSSDKQTRHCLSPDHVACPIYVSARASRVANLAPGVDPGLIAAADAARRGIPRTAPVLLESPRLVDQATRLQLDRTPGQLALVGLMIVAFVVVGLSRMSGGSSPLPVAASATPSVATERPSDAATPTSSVSMSPSSEPSASPSTAPAPSVQGTYTVKKGDTLSRIANKFSTTVAAIRALNGLTNSTIHIGQVLKIP